jgi:prepilin-type N-terminal cleavage/methylation domain-containing protein
MYTYQREKKNRKGFTLVETLVAVTVLLLVVIGPMTIAQKGIKSALYAEDQITAVYLAQEAIEHMERLRDDAALTNYIDYKTDGNDNDGDTWSWYTAIDVNCKQADGCDADFSATPVTFRDCTTASNCLLNVNTVDPNLTRVYGYTVGTNWVQSLFTRRIVLGTPLVVGTEIIGVPVTVTVSWNASLFGSIKTVTLQTYLYDMYDRYE